MTYSMRTTRTSGYTYEPRTANKSPWDTKIMSSRNRAYTYALTCEELHSDIGYRAIRLVNFSGSGSNSKYV